MRQNIIRTLAATSVLTVSLAVTGANVAIAQPGNNNTNGTGTNSTSSTDDPTVAQRNAYAQSTANSLATAEGPSKKR
jgi:hypothetical protein